MPKATHPTQEAQPKQPKRKARIRDWKGFLKEEPRKVKAIVFVLLLFLGSAITFMQFGFIGVGSPGDYSAYILALLCPIAISALLLGKGWATLEGLACGAVLFLHARLQPLDLFELYFVGPFNSIVLYGMAGFMTGLLFAIALRNEPTRVRRGVYITIVCAIISLLVTTTFILNIILDIAVLSFSVFNQGYGLPNEIYSAMVGLGDPVSQVLYDAILMAIVCILTEWLLRRYREQRDYVSALTVFRGQLLSVALIVFVMVQAGAFAYITARTETTAKNDMLDEIDFIGKQLESKDEYIAKLADTVDRRSDPSAFKYDAIAQN